MKTIIASLACLLVSLPLLSQNRVVHGTLSTFNTYPVGNVEVVAKKAGSKVQSDVQGRFDIVCEDKDVIKIKSRVFNPVTLRIGPETDSITINLVFIDNEKNRNYAVGYGYIGEEELTYAVSNLQQKNNDFCSYTSIFELITGRFAGVTVGNKAVYIRGMNSINSGSEALYVVDGVITPSIDWISPCTVSSIDVMKDGAAAIYGSRGANGVVLIELIR